MPQNPLYSGVPDPLQISAIWAVSSSGLALKSSIGATIATFGISGSYSSLGLFIGTEFADSGLNGGGIVPGGTTSAWRLISADNADDGLYGYVVQPANDRATGTSRAFAVLSKSGALSGFPATGETAFIRYDGVTGVSALELLVGATILTTYSILPADGALFVNAAGGNFTATLPAANAVRKGHQVWITKLNATNTVTVAGAGADTIEGAASIALAAQYSKALLVSDGTSVWHRWV